MSAVDVLAQHQSESLRCCLPCGHQSHTRADHAAHQLDALKIAGFAVIVLPAVAHKGPHDTDAMFFRQVADRMETPSRVDFLSGSNVRSAVRALLYRAADAAEACPAMEDSTPTAIAPGVAPSPAGIQHIPGAATTGRTGHTRSALATAAANQLEVWRKNFDLELSRDEYLAELIPELRHLATEIAADGD